MPINEPTPRRLSERTGRHHCANCMNEISAEELFAGDFFCGDCAEKAERYPLATTPNSPEKK